MNYKSVAPCGLVCDLCSGFQREENKCVGCNNMGNKPTYCQSCNIKLCEKKKGNNALLCNKCEEYPCKRIKNLKKRYEQKYGENINENFIRINEIGIKAFIVEQCEKWTCKKCGELLCVHKKNCMNCGEANKYYPLSQ